VKELLKPRSVLIVLGSGGVGKTTIAAALGVAAAAAHLPTAVITVDPARRLRDALGLPRLGGKPTRINAQRLRTAGLDPALKLSAIALDVKGEWDAMVAEHVTDPATRRRILDNAFYRRLSTQFAGSDAYAALEALHDLHSAGHFDFEVVDTPPASHAFEFVRVPARLMRLLDSQGARRSS
jgi:anion-transporting  ArsA/GET3 family ATPase